MAIKEGPRITCKFSVIWTLQLPTIVAIFQWFLFKNRLLTVDNLIRKGWIMPNICNLCRKEAETAQHMFQQCNYTRQVIQMTIHQVRQINFTLDFQQGQYDAIMLEAGNESQKRLQATL
jgi:zinc-binding in reverse transcriptase